MLQARLAQSELLVLGQQAPQDQWVPLGNRAQLDQPVHKVILVQLVSE